MKFCNFSILFFFVLLSCKTIKQVSVTEYKPESKKELNTQSPKIWYQKDKGLNSISGISSDKWYDENKKNPKKEVIVAIIDTQIDINHEDLQGKFWTNSKEIANNNIDDDHNGYVDDTRGWNFASNKKEDYIVWGNFASVRVIRDFKMLFDGKSEDQIPAEKLFKYKEYHRALKAYENENISYKRWQSSLYHSVAVYPLVKETLKQYFPKENYTYQQLDSMYKKHKINDKSYREMRESNDKDLGALIRYMMININNDERNLVDIEKSRDELDSIVNKNLNINYNDRALIGDNPNILEKGYGSNNVSISKKGFKNIQGHCTKVAGIIAANRNNNIGIKGIADNVKIMPLSISYSGDENDKDIAMAIYYAVDNGAKVINMSFGKEFSAHLEWVSDAIKYAEKHNVLLVHCAGNDGFNVDENAYYPSDNTFDGTPEISNNFINVGSISSRLDSTFVSSFSNYGKQNVDLFAPGEDIYTTAKNNAYESDSGTSLAGPMVSGTAALIWSYYPTLTANEVKQIIMDSGTSYDLEVNVPGTKDKKVPFSELSKSGKVLNVYNAMQMAEKVSKHKK
nr:S8 family peptidase [uncultured Flavobacterium sp.]